MAYSPIRILHLIASNFVGGPEKQILHHASDVSHLGIEVWIGSFRDQLHRAEILGQAEQRSLFTFEIHSKGRFDPAPIWCLASFLKRKRIDLLCTHGYKANVLGALAKGLARVPQIAFCRGWTAETAAIRIYEFLDRRSLYLANRIVCVSEAQAKNLARNRFLRSRVSAVQNAVLDPIRPISARERAARKMDLGFAPETKLVGAVGRLSTEKGQRFLVEAAAALRSEFDNLKIVLLGEGRDRESLESKIAELGLEEVVQLLGYQKNIPQWMSALDVLANCSLTEGLPNVVLEAMASGTPVVATRVGGVPELIEHGASGVLVPPADHAALARGLGTVLRNPEYASSLSQSGQKWVESKFSPFRQRELLLAVYEQCLGRELPKSAPAVGGIIRLSSVALTQPSSQDFCRTAEPPSWPLISVVIPVRNEEKHLASVIKGLLSQDYPRDRYEILVVDGNSTDGTARVVKQIAKTADVLIRLIANPRQLSSAGRNAGARESKGELIVFIDGHCHIPSEKLLSDTARIFQTTGADCLCRPQPLSAPGATWFQTTVASARASAIGHGLDSNIYAVDQEGFIDPTSSGACYRRLVFDRVGYYDEHLDACEDVEFNYRMHRAGLRSYTSPRLTIQYHARRSLSGLWNQMLRYGRGRFRFTKLHPEVFSIGQAMPPVFVLWLLFGGLAALGFRLAGTAYLPIVASYVAIISGFSVRLGFKHGWRHALVGPSIYATIHIGLGLGFVMEALQFLMRSALSRSQREDTPSSTSKGVLASGDLVQVLIPEQQKPPQALHVNRDNGGLPRNALSVDVEDYFHTEAMSSIILHEQWEYMPTRVEKNTHRLFELLAKYNVRGTLFFLGWVAEKYPRLVREAVQAGHEVACHSYWHRRVYTVSPEQFRADTFRAKQAIENACGVRVRGYRAPSFSIVQGTEWALDVLMELGFDYDSSVNPIRHDLYNNASAPRVPHWPGGRAILELPIATTRFCGTTLPIGGGGYMRILPYAYMRWGLSRFSRLEARSAIVYLHPWEIDPEQPRLAASLRSRFRQYSRLSTTEQKLEKLLRQFAFAPIVNVFTKELLDAAALRKDRSREQSAERVCLEVRGESAFHAADPAGDAKWFG